MAGPLVERSGLLVSILWKSRILTVFTHKALERESIFSDSSKCAVFAAHNNGPKGRVLSNAIEPMLYSIPQTCTALGLSRSKTYELISEGRLLTVNIGRRRLVRVDSVKALAQGEAA